MLRTSFRPFSVSILLTTLAACGADTPADAPAESTSPANPIADPIPDGGGAEPRADAAPPEIPRDPANVVFVLADDLSWNLVDYMPNVQKMQKEGVTFDNY